MNFRTVLFFIMILSVKPLFSQGNYLCIGFNNNGLCFGSPKNFNGLKFGFFDRNVNDVNGCNIAIGCFTKKTNGVSLGLIAVNASRLNGLAIAGSGIGIESKFNGLGVSGLRIYADTLNGLFISLFGITEGRKGRYLIKEMNGLAIGGIVGVNCKTFNGVVLGILNKSINQNGLSFGLRNYTENLHGIQIGLWNIATNKKYFRKLPFINFCFKKNIQNQSSNIQN